jgi:hypothetical protein
MSFEILFCGGLWFVILTTGVAYHLYIRFQWRKVNAIEYHRAWYQLADKLQLEFDTAKYQASARVSGVYRGRSLTLNLLIDPRSPEDTETRILLALKHNLNGEFLLEESGWLERSRKYLTSIGNPRRHHPLIWRFQYVSNPAAFAESVLGSSNMRNKLLSARSVRIELRDQQLVYLHQGIVDDVEYIVFLFDLLSDVARLMDGIDVEDIKGS